MSRRLNSKLESQPLKVKFKKLKIHKTKIYKTKTNIYFRLINKRLLKTNACPKLK